MPSPLAADYLKLPISERIQLVGDIWDSIAEEASKLPEADDPLALTEAEKAELRRRVAEYEADPSSAIPWETVREQMRQNLPG